MSDVGMALLSNCAAAVLLTAFVLLTCLFVSHHENRMAGSVLAEENKPIAHKRFQNNPRKPQNNSTETMGTHPEIYQETDVFSDDRCIMSPESRFDCARDMVLSQRECEKRGCCYDPLPNFAGPPWCFYPHLYPGYKMGPLNPTLRGQSATLTRATPSYLPKDIPTLHLEVTEETAGCLHLTVSNKYSLSKV